MSSAGLLFGIKGKYNCRISIRSYLVNQLPSALQVEANIIRAGIDRGPYFSIQAIYSGNQAEENSQLLVWMLQINPAYIRSLV